MVIALTKQQQELVEQNHNLIYNFAHQNNLSLDDYYDILAIGMCNAAKAYSEDKGAFSTLAYICMKNELGKYWRKFQAKGAIPTENIVSYDASLSDGTNGREIYLDCFADDNCTCDIAISNIIYEEFCNTLTDKERFVTEMLIRSATHSQIAKTIGCTKQSVGYHVCRIRKKMLNYLNNC